MKKSNNQISLEHRNFLRKEKTNKLIVITHEIKNPSKKADK